MRSLREALKAADSDVGSFCLVPRMRATFQHPSEGAL